MTRAPGTSARAGRTANPGAGEGTAGPRVDGAGGAFAGYVWNGHRLRALRADWSVPSIASTSPFGRASTWIGAVAPAGASVSQRFIQVGTQEELNPVGAGTFDAAHTRFYEAFWSDATQGYEPRSLFRVHPGDRVDTALTLEHGTWQVTISDESSGRSAHFATRQEADGAFDEAQFLQEDPTDAASLAALPYPSLTPTRMTSVSVNGHPAGYGSLASSWMTLPQGYLGPTPLAHDAFSIVPRRLTAAGARFLEITGTFNAEDDRFSKLLGDHPARTILRVGLQRFTAALSRAVTQLRAISWPVGVAPAIGRLAAIYAGQVAQLRMRSGAGAEVIASVFPRGRARRADQALAHRIARGLGIQEVP